jgi:hypothetical protein
MDSPIGVLIQAILDLPIPKWSVADCTIEPEFVVENDSLRVVLKQDSRNVQLFIKLYPNPMIQFCSCGDADCRGMAFPDVLSDQLKTLYGNLYKTLQEEIRIKRAKDNDRLEKKKSEQPDAVTICLTAAEELRKIRNSE